MTRDTLRPTPPALRPGLLLVPPLLALALVGATCRGSEDKAGGPLGAGATAQAATPAKPPDDGLTPEEFNARLPGIDPSGLSPKQRLDLAQLTEDTFCPCAPMTVAGCLRAKDRCHAAVRLTEFAKKMLVAGQPAATALLRVETYYGSFPRDRRQKVAQTGPRKGPENPKITLVEFSDLECPVCKAANPSIEAVAKTYEKDLALVFRHFPLPMHKHAELAAHAAVYAHQHGKFWPFAEAVFARQAELGEPLIKDIAKSLGLDPDAAVNALKDEQIDALVKADKAEAEALQVGGTPTVFVNGRQHLLPANLEWLTWTIDDEFEWIANGESWVRK